MAHQEDFDSFYQTLHNQLGPSCSISSIRDLSQILTGMGIPAGEVSTITDIFEKLGFRCFIDVEGVTSGEGYQVKFHDPGEYLALSRDEIDTEIYLLQGEMESTTDESKKISFLRQIAKITGQLATIQVPYRSEEEWLGKKRVLSAYIKLAREIVDRSYPNYMRSKISLTPSICSWDRGPSSKVLTFSSTCWTVRKPGIGIVRGWRARIQANAAWGSV